jgi:hypothetical protein
MTRPQNADGGDGLQIWNIATNTLNKQWRTAEKLTCYETSKGPRILTDSLGRSLLIRDHIEEYRIHGRISCAIVDWIHMAQGRAQ